MRAIRGSCVVDTKYLIYTAVELMTHERFKTLEYYLVIAFLPCLFLIVSQGVPIALQKTYLSLTMNSKKKSETCNRSSQLSSTELDHFHQISRYIS